MKRSTRSIIDFASLAIAIGILLAALGHGWNFYIALGVVVIHGMVQWTCGMLEGAGR